MGTLVVAALRAGEEGKRSEPPGGRCPPRRPRPPLPLAQRLPKNPAELRPGCRAGGNALSAGIRLQQEQGAGGSRLRVWGMLRGGLVSVVPFGGTNRTGERGGWLHGLEGKRSGKKRGELLDVEGKARFGDGDTCEIYRRNQARFKSHGPSSARPSKRAEKSRATPLGELKPD